MSTVAILESRIAEIGRSRLMYGKDGWTPERAGTDSLNVKRLLNEIEELNTWRVHKKESVARITNLRQRIDALTSQIHLVDNHMSKTVKGGVHNKRNVSCALRLQRKNLEVELRQVHSSWSAPTDVDMVPLNNVFGPESVSSCVAALIQDELRYAAICGHREETCGQKETSWADEE